MVFLRNDEVPHVARRETYQRALGIFAWHPKNTFATISATSRYGRRGIIASGADHEGQTFGNFTASHFASAAFTATGHSCAIQWPDWIITSVRSPQY